MAMSPPPPIDERGSDEAAAIAAAAPSPAPPPPGSAPTGRVAGPHALAAVQAAQARHRLRGLVRDMRAHAQAILAALPPVSNALKLTEEATRNAELEKALRELRHALRNRAADIEGCRLDARALLDASPVVYDEVGDAVTNLLNAWDRALRALDRMTATDPAAVSARIEEVIAAIDAVQWDAAIVTMPPRVNAHLETLNVGGQLHFGDAFSDELSTEPSRKRFLLMLKSHPASVSGAVDAELGVIYKAARGPRRIFSYLLLAFLAGPAALLAINFATGGSRELRIPADWLFQGESRQAELWSAYVFVVIGVLVHLVLEAVKQAQRSTDKAFLALGDWLTWIHVREMSLAITILTMWAIPIGLALTLSDRVGVETAFFAGYSIDSVIGIFLTRFDGLASSSSDALLKRLTPAPAPKAPSAAAASP